MPSYVKADFKNFDFLNFWESMFEWVSLFKTKSGKAPSDSGFEFSIWIIFLIQARFMKYLRKSGSALEVQLKASVISAIENVLSLNHVRKKILYRLVKALKMYQKDQSYSNYLTKRP